MLTSLVQRFAVGTEVMTSMRSEGWVIDTIVCLTLAKWETVSGPFGGYLTTKVPRKETRPPLGGNGRGRTVGGAVSWVLRRRGRRPPFPSLARRAQMKKAARK
jgi:hypothetical protein